MRILLRNASGSLHDRENRSAGFWDANITIYARVQAGTVRRFAESDVAVYAGAGAFTVLVFAVGVAAAVAAGLIDPARRELAGLAVGFGLFLFSYAFAMGAYRIVER